MRITVEHSTIRALLTVAPKVDVRYYLVGIAVDVRADDVTLIATDGHVMLTVPLPADAVEDRAPGVYILSRDALEAVKPAKAGRTVLPIAITIDTEPDRPDPDRPGVTIKGKTAVSIQGAATVATSPIDGVYPDWRRVMPATASGEPAQFNHELLSRFGDVTRLLGRKFMHVHYNGQAGALVTFDGADALGVLIPLRSFAEGHPGLPAWAKAC